MNRAIALSMPQMASQLDPIELARRLIVLGCAAALIFAGRPLPF